MSEIKRWCRQCGKYRPISGFDLPQDGKRRFCGMECYQKHVEGQERKRRSYD